MKQELDTTFHVGGMTCNACPHHIKRALFEVDGVKRVEVHLREGKVLVTHEPGAGSVAALMEALGHAGYEVDIGLAGEA